MPTLTAPKFATPVAALLMKGCPAPTARMLATHAAAVLTLIRYTLTGHLLLYTFVAALIVDARLGPTASMLATPAAAVR